MADIALSWVDRCATASVATYTDGGDISAATVDSNLPLTNLQTADITQPARFTGLPTSAPSWSGIRFDFGSELAIDVVALLGCSGLPDNWTATDGAIVNVTLDFRNAANVSIGTQSFEVDELAGIPGAWRNYYAKLPATLSPRYVVVQIRGDSSPSATNLNIGRIWCGKALRISNTMAEGWSVQPVDLGDVAYSRTGLAYPSPKGVVNRLRAQLLGLTDAQAKGTNTYAGGVTEGVADVVAQNGIAKPMILMPRRTEATMYGYLETLPPDARVSSGGGWDMSLTLLEAA